LEMNPLTKKRHLLPEKKKKNCTAVRKLRSLLTFSEGEEEGERALPANSRGKISFSLTSKELACYSSSFAKEKGRKKRWPTLTRKKKKKKEVDSAPPR